MCRPFLFFFLFDAALLALVALLGVTGSAAQTYYAPPKGCPKRAQAQSYCPRFFRGIGQGSAWLPFDINRPGSPIQRTGPTSGQISQTALVYRLDEPLEKPCISLPSSCRLSGGGLLECTLRMMNMEDNFLQILFWTQMIPGSPAACGHGNREFSFYVRPADRGVASGAASLEKVLLIFAAGGMCWDAEGCGNTAQQKMGSGNNKWSSPNGKSPETPARLLRYLWSGQERDSKPGILDMDAYPDYDAVLVPDCTGDMNLGNRSYTYDAQSNSTCITAHHRGGINTGLAVDWLVNPKNSKKLREILILATGYNDMGMGNAFGAHGPAFWAQYIQKRVPDALVRVVTEQSLGLHGPGFSKVIENDPWGTLQLHEPGSNTLLLPPPSVWSFAHDDMTSYYEYVAKTTPSIAFADVATMHDPSQMALFKHFGGMDRQCCVDGCSCQSGGDDGIEAGQLDWIKTVKVTILQRHQRLGKNYRSWLSHTPIRYFMLATELQLEDYLTLIGASARWRQQVSIKTLCPKVKGSTSCPVLEPGTKYPSYSILDQFVRKFGESTIQLDEVGQIKSDNLPGRTYEERVFGDFTCTGCLDGVPGGQSPLDERCNATFAEGETLFSVAPKYHSDWMLLWSLNGGESPDTVSATGKPYRFAHQVITVWPFLLLPLACLHVHCESGSRSWFFLLTLSLMLRSTLCKGATLWSRSRTHLRRRPRRS